jgi:hypothetical protein
MLVLNLTNSQGRHINSADVKFLNVLKTVDVSSYMVLTASFTKIGH